MRLSHRLIAIVVSCSCLAMSRPSVAPAAEPEQALKYRTTWLGNTFGGGDKWVQNFAEGPEKGSGAKSMSENQGQEPNAWKNRLLHAGNRLLNLLVLSLVL